MEFYNLVKNLNNTTKFVSIPIEDEKLKKILNSMRMALSVNNTQPWKFVITRDEDKKRKLVSVLGNSYKFLLDAPLLIIACANPDESFPTLGGYMNSYPLDMGIIIDRLLLAVANEGLAVNWITDFHEDKIKPIFMIPENIHVVSIFVVGYPAEPGSNPGRKNLEEIICYENYL